MTDALDAAMDAWEAAAGDPFDTLQDAMERKQYLAARAAILAEFATLGAELLKKQGYIDGFKAGVAQELAALRAALTQRRDG